jgi:formylglycine-generating enzyme required for sulfatase activity
MPKTVIIHRHQQTNQFYEEILDKDVTLRMMLIPAGKFLMGSPDDEPQRYDGEGPQHEVTIPTFFLAKYPVTQEQWRIVAALPQIQHELNPDPSRFKGDRRPVESISWYEAVEFCDRLARHTVRPYRLPTEAEWEYACRAVTSYQSRSVARHEAISVTSEELTLAEWNEKYNQPFHFGQTITTELANYRGTDNDQYGWKGNYADGPKGEYRQETTPVDHFGIANNFGLCDLHGNVFEWCQDHWHKNYEGAPNDGSAWLTDNENASRIVRGGCWVYGPDVCRSAYRNNVVPDTRNSSFGLRVACAAPRTQ